jgi:uncharacterized protein YbjQ (UPF0145 family)
VQFSFRNTSGCIGSGEIHDYTKLLAESREQSFGSHDRRAERGGANAVVGVRFATSVLMGGAAELMVEDKLLN